jgi:hypothetical protein
MKLEDRSFIHITIAMMTGSNGAVKGLLYNRSKQQQPLTIHQFSEIYTP